MSKPTRKGEENLQFKNQMQGQRRDKTLKFTYCKRKPRFESKKEMHARRQTIEPYKSRQTCILHANSHIWMRFCGIPEERSHRWSGVGRWRGRLWRRGEQGHREETGESERRGEDIS